MELDAWQEELSSLMVIPLGRCGKGSRLPDFSAGPLNGPKHLQDTVSSLPFLGVSSALHPCISLLVLTLLQAPWNPGWGGSVRSRFSFPLFSILCREALILGGLGALLERPHPVQLSLYGLRQRGLRLGCTGSGAAQHRRGPTGVSVFPKY